MIVKKRTWSNFSKKLIFAAFGPYYKYSDPPEYYDPENPWRNDNSGEDFKERAKKALDKYVFGS